MYVYVCVCVFEKVLRKLQTLETGNYLLMHSHPNLLSMLGDDDAGEPTAVFEILKSLSKPDESEEKTLPMDVYDLHQAHEEPVGPPMVDEQPLPRVSNHFICLFCLSMCVIYHLSPYTSMDHIVSSYITSFFHPPVVVCPPWHHS